MDGNQYLWLVVVGSLGAFLFGYGTGSNDVANAFGTSVGAKTLSLRQAVLIAAVFEFGGALLLGRVSTATIAGGIADITAFQREPEVYAYGMVMALIVSGMWQIVASYLELNVSSTHSIVGSILGFALVYGGSASMRWADPDPKAFPPYKGVVPIIVSWFVSPVLTGLVAALFFWIARTLLLRRANAYSLSFWLLPFLVFITVFVSIFFVFTKGVKKTLASEGSDWTDTKSAWVSVLVAAGCGIVTAAVVLPWLRYKSKKKFGVRLPVMSVTGSLELKPVREVAAAVEQAAHVPHSPHTHTASSGNTNSGGSSSGSDDNAHAPQPHSTPVLQEVVTDTGSGRAGQLELLPVVVEDNTLQPVASGTCGAPGANHYSKQQTTAAIHPPHQSASDSVLLVHQHHVMSCEEREAAMAAARAAAAERQLQKKQAAAQAAEAELAKSKLTVSKRNSAGSSSGGDEELRLRSISSISSSFVRAISQGLSTIKKGLLYGPSVDVHEVVEDDPLIAAIHANAEVFDPQVEYSFSFLQVFSAICVMFAHGANEVGYMAGPLTTIWRMYKTGKLTSNVAAPAWVVLISAVGLVLGLATYGYNVTRAMGVRLSKLSPTRGFCAELSTALVILVCSQYGLPTSSSQAITGGIIGVGCMEGRMGVNWKFFGRQFGSWVATLFISGIFTAALFAQGIYAPGKISGAAQQTYEDRVTNLTVHLYDEYQSSLLQYQGHVGAGSGGLLPSGLSLSAAELNAAISSAAQAAKALASTTVQTVSPDQVMSSLYKALALYQQSTVLTVGQSQVYPGAASGVCNTPQGLPGTCPAPSLLPTAYNQTFL